ncbi:ComEA family DNA-binding protein [Jeotgalicoccus psychrophilus]|uniref:ComEA family DNA-binding protein n=1 Tax=Jeotgalicoccus psychrophilus TaxID=157228 RepID=UPI00040A8846|nr:ComEA family DNA-binding protein [Jeotgalicoccus psychrophilus]
MDIKSFFEQYKFYVIGGIAAVIILVYFLITSIQEPVESLAFDSGSAEPEVEEPVEVSVPAATVFVEVKGAVSTPGVYELPSDARVKNVLDIAVLSDKADLMTVNQSAKLTDEMVIYIPYEGEIDESAVLDLVEGGTGTSDASDQLVNINTAGIDELTTLNGIGEKKAQAILTYREEQGLFATLEDLKNIPGIGDKTFENLKPYITIN